MRTVSALELRKRLGSWSPHRPGERIVMSGTTIRSRSLSPAASEAREELDSFQRGVAPRGAAGRERS